MQASDADHKSGGLSRYFIATPRIRLERKIGGSHGSGQ